MPKVICLQNMKYDGVDRYKGEVIALIGARNDDALVRVGHVRVITGDSNLTPVRDDYSGREFIDERALETYRMVAPREAIIIRRGPGRPRKEATA